MRVHVVDPSAYTPPYDDALCSALADAGAEVELYTSRFTYGPVPAPRGYRRHELFYRLAHRQARRVTVRGELALAAKLAEHGPGMLRYRRAARAADVVHFQWLTVQQLDVHLLPRSKPLVLTAHDVLPREPRRGQLAAQRRLYERMDAIVVHSEHGRRRLIEELGVESQRVHVIPHGVLSVQVEDEGDVDVQLPPTLAGATGPVVLLFGLLRPYKGLDLLLEAWRDMRGAQLWVVGMERMDISALRASAPSSVRFATGFVSPQTMAAVFERADLVVLPYREIDQSGVAFTAVGAGRPLVLSDVGGFPELAATGAARLFPSGDAPALRAVLQQLLDDAPARARMAAAARAAAAGPFAWGPIARRTLALYESLLADATAKPG